MAEYPGFETPSRPAMDIRQCVEKFFTFFGQTGKSFQKNVVLENLFRDTVDKAVSLMYYLQ